jgi:hypothetical protein
MKKLVLPLAASLVVLCGCAHSYVMKLSNGVRIVTPSKPRLKGANYYFKDAMGRENVMPQSRVTEISPASMVTEDNKFQPTPPKKTHWWHFW